MQRLIPNCFRLFLLAIFCFSGVVSAQTSDDTQAAETATEEVPVKKGKLRIKSSPAGAKVWIDHVEVGRTPLEVSLPAGKHKVRISKDRHQPHNTVKVVAHRVRPINVELKRQRRSGVRYRHRRRDTYHRCVRNLPLRLKSPLRPPTSTGSQHRDMNPSVASLMEKGETSTSAQTRKQLMIRGQYNASWFDRLLDGAEVARRH